MDKNVLELIAKLENLTRRLKHVDKDGIVNTLHVIELFCELSDIVLGFNVEQYHSDESSWEDSSTEENKKPT